METKVKKPHVFLEDKDRILISWLVKELNDEYDYWDTVKHQSRISTLKLAELIQKIKYKHLWW